MAGLALESCRKYLKNAAADETDGTPEGDTFGGWKLSDIQLHFLNHALVFKHSDDDLVVSDIYVQTKIGLYIERKGSCWLGEIEPVGEYFRIVQSSGEPEDDWLRLFTVFEAEDE